MELKVILCQLVAWKEGNLICLEGLEGFESLLDFAPMNFAGGIPKSLIFRLV